MRKRLENKIIKRKAKLILEEFKKYFKIEKKSIGIYSSYGSGILVFNILEQPCLKIGVRNITPNCNINTAWYYMAPKHSYEKFHPVRCKEENTSRDLKEFIFRLKQAINDFENVMKYEDETLEEFWEMYNQAKVYNSSILRKRIGIESDEYNSLKFKIYEFLKNIDYKKIPTVVLNFETDFFCSTGIIYFYPDWKKCDDEYLDEFEDQIHKLKLSSFQWRDMRIKMPKKQRKNWTVYTEGKTRTLFKYLKEEKLL